MSASKSVAKKSVKSESVVTAPVVEKKVAAKKVAVPTGPTAPTTVPTGRATTPAHTVPAPTGPVATDMVVDSTTELTLKDEVKAVQDALTAIRDATTAALAALKRVTRRAENDVKDARKKKRSAKTTEDGAERKPSNFEIPVAISDELSAFFGGGKAAMMSRAEVNKRMFAYSKENSLSEGQIIHLVSTPELLAKGYKPAAATALVKLLAIPDGAKLTIFNIQKYMGRHYSKPTTA